MANEGQWTGSIACEATAAAIAEHLFVTADSTSDATKISVALSGAGEKIFGVSLQTTTVAADNIAVAIDGVVFLTVDGNAGAISIGDRLKSDANGLGVKTTTDTNEIGAVALQASTTDGEKIKVAVVPYTMLAG